MLGLAVLFLVLAFAAYFLGANQAGNFAKDVAKFLFVLFVVLLILSLVLGMVAPGPYWGWPVYRSVP